MADTSEQEDRASEERGASHNLKDRPSSGPLMNDNGLTQEGGEGGGGDNCGTPSAKMQSPRGAGAADSNSTDTKLSGSSGGVMSLTAATISPRHKDPDRIKKDREREERVRQAREKLEEERKKKLIELQEQQRQAQENREKQLEMRKKKIEDLRRREMERRQEVEKRRRERETAEKSRRETLLLKAEERVARYEAWKRGGQKGPPPGSAMPPTKHLSVSTSVLYHKRHSDFSSSGALNTSNRPDSLLALNTIPEGRRSVLAPPNLSTTRPKSVLNISSAGAGAGGCSGVKMREKSSTSLRGKPRPASVAGSSMATFVSVTDPGKAQGTPRSKSTDRLARGDRPRSRGAASATRAEDSKEDEEKKPFDKSGVKMSRKTLDRLSTPRQVPNAGDGDRKDSSSTPRRESNLVRTSPRKAYSTSNLAMPRQKFSLHDKAKEAPAKPQTPKETLKSQKAKDSPARTPQQRKTLPPVTSKAGPAASSTPRDSSSSPRSSSRSPARVLSPAPGADEDGGSGTALPHSVSPTPPSVDKPASESPQPPQTPSPTPAVEEAPAVEAAQPISSPSLPTPQEKSVAEVPEIEVSPAPIEVAVPDDAESTPTPASIEVAVPDDAESTPTPAPIEVAVPDDAESTPTPAPAPAPVPAPAPAEKSKVETPQSRGTPTSSGEKSKADITAEEYKARLAEKRRQAREKAEREAEEERRRKEEEERLEEERRQKEEEEEKRREEEANRLAAEGRKAEEERLQKAIEAEEARKAEEAARLEQERLAKEEADRKAKEEAERLELERQEKVKKDEEERLERKKKLEMIMKRVKTTNAGEGAKDSPRAGGSPARSFGSPVVTIGGDSAPVSATGTPTQPATESAEEERQSSVENNGNAEDSRSPVSGARSPANTASPVPFAAAQDTPTSMSQSSSQENMLDSNQGSTPTSSRSQSPASMPRGSASETGDKPKFRSPLLQKLVEGKDDEGSGGEAPRFKSPLLQNLLSKTRVGARMGLTQQDFSRSSPDLSQMEGSNGGSGHHSAQASASSMVMSTSMMDMDTSQPAPSKDLLSQNHSAISASKEELNRREEKDVDTSEDSSSSHSSPVRKTLSGPSDSGAVASSQWGAQDSGVSLGASDLYSLAPAMSLNGHDDEDIKGLEESGIGMQQSADSGSQQEHSTDDRHFEELIDLSITNNTSTSTSTNSAVLKNNSDDLVSFTKLEEGSEESTGLPPPIIAFEESSMRKHQDVSDLLS